MSCVCGIVWRFFSSIRMSMEKRLKFRSISVRRPQRLRMIRAFLFSLNCSYISCSSPVYWLFQCDSGTPMRNATLETISYSSPRRSRYFSRLDSSSTSTMGAFSCSIRCPFSLSQYYTIKDRVSILHKFKLTHNRYICSLTIALDIERRFVFLLFPL